MKKSLLFLFLIISFQLASSQTLELIKDIGQSPIEGSPMLFKKFNGKVYFIATDSAYGTELWVTDGSEVGTHIVKDINSGGLFNGGQKDIGCFEFFGHRSGILNNELYFTGLDTVHGTALWKTDGSSAGTVMVKDIDQKGPASLIWNNSLSNNFNKLNGKLIFTATDSIYDQELWVTDGTTAGTQLVKNINPYKYHFGGSSRADFFTFFDNKYFFTANDSTHGAEIWVTDGTTSGTQLFLDLDAFHGYPNINNSSVPREYYVLNNQLFFIANSKLYRTDGTVSGTECLSDSLNPNNWSPKMEHQAGSNSTQYKYFTEMGGKLYFIGSNAATGRELWVTNGTKAGTKMVKEMTTGIYIKQDAIKGEIAILNNSKLLFYGRTDSNIGYQLWESNGTAAGTNLLKQTTLIGSNLNTGIYYKEYNSELYFQAWSDSVGLTIWKTDGTEVGTNELWIKSFNGLNNYPIVFNNRIYFVANHRDSNNIFSRNLWESEGDVSNTKIIKPLGDSTLSAILSLNTSYNDYIELNGSLIFSANWSGHGQELWKLTTTPLSIISYDKKKLDFTLYPNPAKSIINIASKERLIRTKIYDLNGRLVLEGNNKEVNVSSLSNGFYILKIKTDKGTGTAKFQVNK